MPIEAPALNPTGGVTPKPPVVLDYKKDPTRPGGGVFVAHGNSKEDFQDLPEGTVISASSDDDAAGSDDGNVPLCFIPVCSCKLITDPEQVTMRKGRMAARDRLKRGSHLVP